MSGRVVIVTGAGRGIGRTVARGLLQANHKVVIVSRTETELESLKKKFPDQVEYLVADLSDTSFAKKIVDLAVKSFGKIDALVINHAELEPLTRVIDSTVDEWKKVFDVNFFTPVALVQAAIPELRKTHGRIIFTSSGAAKNGYVSWGPYGSSKAALHSLAQHLGAEEKDIVTVSISPGRTDTGMQGTLREKGKGRMSDADHADFVAAFENGKLNKPEDPGMMIAKLSLTATPDLSGRYYLWSDPDLQPDEPEHPKIAK